MKKKIGMIALVILSFAINRIEAEEVVTWPNKTATIDTGWVDVDPSQSCPETHYPVIIEIMPLEGDSVRYKAVFIPKPTGHFVYKSVVGLKTHEFETLDKDLSLRGFIKVSHQVVTLMQVRFIRPFGSVLPAKITPHHPKSINLSIEFELRTRSR